MKKLKIQQLAKYINEAVDSNNSYYVPWGIAVGIAEQLCYYFDSDELWDELTPEDVMVYLEEAMGSLKEYEGYFNGEDSSEDGEWEDFIFSFMDLINKNS